MSIVSSLDTIQKPSLFTPWSCLHFTHGILAGSLHSCRHFLAWNLIHALYECKDLYLAYKKHKNLNPQLSSCNIQNSWINSVGDQFSFHLGLYLTCKYKISWKQALLIESIALLTMMSPLFPNSLTKKHEWNVDIWYHRG